LSDFAGATPNTFNKNFSSVLETSHTNFGGGTNVSGSGIAEPKAATVNSINPIVPYSQTDLNDTIMIDDLVSNYVPDQKQPKKPKTKPPQQGSFDMLTDEKTHVNSTITPAKPATTSEDIYTFRFLTNQPIEVFDPNEPIEQHSYLYNGSVNQPAFEIISHADIRPATPVRFEHVKDFSIHQKSPLRQKKKHPKDYETTERHRDRPGYHHHHHHHSRHRPTNHDEYIFKEKIYDDGGFESASWFSNRPHYRETSRSPNRRGRSFTTPSKLNYGNQESIYVRGKPVEWQMAGELRTTDWDRLKYFTDNTLHSFYEPTRRYEMDNYKRVDRTQSFLSNDYSLPKKKPSAEPTNKMTESYSNARRNSSFVDKNSYASYYPEEGDQSSKIYKKTDNKKTLLDYISSNSSDISSYSKLNLYKNKLIDNSNFISNEIKNNIQSNKKSDYNETNLSFYDDLEERRNEEIETEREKKKPAILTKIIRDPDTNEILSRQQISPNESNNRIKANSNDDSNVNQQERNNISVIDVTYTNSPKPVLRKLSSLNQDSEFSFSRSTSNVNTPPLSPPPQFQQQSNDNNTSIITVNNISNIRKFSENRLSPIPSKRSSSSSNYDRNSSEYTKHENEDFQPSEILNINQSIYQSKMDSPVLLPKSSQKSSFNEQSKMILENKPRNLFQDIQTFDPHALRNVQTKVNDPLIYEKIVETSSNRSSSVMSNNNNLLSSKYRPPSVIKSVSSQNDDRNSIVSSTNMSKRSSNFY